MSNSVLATNNTPGYPWSPSTGNNEDITKQSWDIFVLIMGRLASNACDPGVLLEVLSRQCITCMQFDLSAHLKSTSVHVSLLFQFPVKFGRSTGRIWQINYVGTELQA